MDIETVTGRFRDGRPDSVVWLVSPQGRARPGGAASRARQVTMRNRISALSRARTRLRRASGTLAASRLTHTERLVLRHGSRLRVTGLCRPP
jgi:hypothetical protein